MEKIEHRVKEVRIYETVTQTTPDHKKFKTITIASKSEKFVEFLDGSTGWAIVEDELVLFTWDMDLKVKVQKGISVEKEIES